MRRGCSDRFWFVQGSKASCAQRSQSTYRRCRENRCNQGASFQGRLNIQGCSGQQTQVASGPGNRAVRFEGGTTGSKPDKCTTRTTNLIPKGKAVLSRHGVMQWFGTGVLVLGALVVSAIQSSALHWPVFAAFLLGHTLLVYDSFITSHRPYFFLNASLAAMDMYAIFIRVM